MITDELRTWSARRLAGWKMAREEHDELAAIADRIDAEHEAKVSYWQGASYKDGYDEGFASADDWLGQHEDAMAEHGWVRLPVDADGVPWHVGDVNENGRTITTMCLTAHGWHFSNIQNDIDPSIHRHYQPDTWERVLRDAFDAGVLGETFDLSAAVARCKALCERTKGVGE